MTHEEDPQKTFSLEQARALDREDPLADFRSQYHIPVQENGAPVLYLCGNSLGLQPRRTRAFILEELDDWARFGVEGHVHARHPWMPYHEFLTGDMADVVGARPEEVVVMNSLSVNLHLLMVSFYRPTRTRYKILIEHKAFPSDQYAVRSQAEFHARHAGFDPASAVIEWLPDPRTNLFEMQQLEDILNREGDSIALILIGNVNYYSGQAFDMKRISALGHGRGCVVGFDLAHGAGNLSCDLHDSGADFAAWCSYKYLNSGPGSLSGVFVHERHARAFDLPRFSGWWGHDKASRFRMPDTFQPMPGAEGWQLSNPPILAMAAMRASLSLFREAGMERLVRKSRDLTEFLFLGLERLPANQIVPITPRPAAQRGCQVSLRTSDRGKFLFQFLTDQGVIADWREPDVIRIAPVPMYNTFEDIYHFCRILAQGLEQIS